MDGIETPSGKDAGSENFPVGSWLLPADLRPHVMAFYHFVRAADDIADNGDLAAEDKLERLDFFEQALLGDEALLANLPKAASLRRSLEETGVTDRHARDILKAFRQDAAKTRYRDWADLLDYCAHSASPVGRYLLDLHGEDQALYQLSDPLCDALQILNHLQDCADDYRELDRVYLPDDFFAGENIDHAALVGAKACSGLRKILDKALDGTDELLHQAAGLPAGLKSRRLGAESAVILEMARKLRDRLRRQDPIATRVELSKFSFAVTALRGLGRLQWLRRGGRPGLRLPEGAVR